MNSITTLNAKNVKAVHQVFAVQQHRNVQYICAKEKDSVVFLRPLTPKKKSY